MKAMLDSRCADCGGGIKAGTEITSTDSGWTHVVCPPSKLDLQRPVCQICFLEVSISGECGCGVLS